MSSNQSFNYPFRIGDSTSFGQALSQLDDKLDLIKRKISYFDTYNITNVVTDSSMFSAQVNNLPANEALVINCNPFAYGDDNFVQGDVVLKIASGQMVHIKSLTGGVYYPKKINSHTDANTNQTLYNIEYEFSGSAPSVPTSTVDLNQDASIAKNIVFQNLASASIVNIYGLWSAMTKNTTTTTYEFSAATTEDDYLIRPFVEFYFCSVNTAGVAIPAERVEVDYTLTANATDQKWTVTINQPIDDLYIKVK